MMHFYTTATLSSLISTADATPMTAAAAPTAIATTNTTVLWALYTTTWTLLQQGLTAQCQHALADGN